MAKLGDKIIPLTSHWNLVSLVEPPSQANHGQWTAAYSRPDEAGAKIQRGAILCETIEAASAEAAQRNKSITIPGACNH